LLMVTPVPMMVALLPQPIRKVFAVLKREVRRVRPKLRLPNDAA